MSYLVKGLTKEKDDAPLKRFLTLSSDELRDEYPSVLETLCQELVPRRRYRSSPKLEKLLAELIRQPSLLTPAIFVKGLLSRNSRSYRVQFIKYGWREAVEEGLREVYPGGRQTSVVGCNEARVFKAISSRVSTIK